MSIKKLRLQSMIFIFFVIVSLVPVTFLTIWMQRSGFTHERDTVRDRHLLLARNLTVTLSRYAIDIEAIFNDIATQLQQENKEQSHDIIESIDISLLVTVDAEGNIIKLHHGELEQLPSEDLSTLLTSDLWRDFGRIRFTGVMASRTGAPSIFLMRPIAEGGWVLGNLTTDYIIEVQQTVTFGKQGHAAIVDHTGHILAHPTKEWQQQMKDISKLAPVQAMMAAKTGVAQFYSPAVKAEMVAGYATVKSTGWGVMIPQPIAELEERAAQVQTQGSIVAALGVLTALLLSWGLSRSITRPIKATVEAAALLAQNQADSQKQLPKSSMAVELETLCSSFNQMADQIEQARSTLEERVEQRTQALNAEIRERKALEEKFRYMATHDQLTGLANRALFFDRLHKALQHSSRTGLTTSLLFIDLDGFKEVNDQLGHLAGDKLLYEVAKVLQLSVRECDTVSRYGGDEFVILLQEAGTRDNIATIAEKIITQLAKPISIEDKTARVTATIGIALAEEGISPELLLRKADTAMYLAKGLGKNRYQFS